MQEDDTTQYLIDYLEKKYDMNENSKDIKINTPDPSLIEKIEWILQDVDKGII